MEIIRSSRMQTSSWLAVVLQLLLSLGHSMGQDPPITLQYFVEEETGPNVNIGNTARDSGLYVSGGPFDQLSFKTFEKGNTFLQYMTVDESTGVIRTTKNIDREELCQKAVNCTMKFDIGVYKREASLVFQNVIRVVIYVTDINDNSPEFPRRVVDLRVPENFKIDHSLYTSVAADADATGINSSITYRLERPNDLFVLSTIKATSGIEDLVITIKESLDREKKSLYPLTVVATDQGMPPRSGSVLINIIVTDMNDHSPVFGVSSYTVNILENSDINAPVEIVSATDADEGANAKLTYELSSQVSQEIRSMFTVDPNTGKIFARKPLDFEKRKQYQFYVTASDNGNPPETAFAYVTVNVIDVNDNAPVIVVNPAPGGDVITENGSVGKFLGHIVVSDKDSGVNGQVTCRINDYHFRLERYDGIYKIVLQSKLDREESPTRNVTVVCQDGDLRPMVTSATFIVTIRDVNDNAPVFVPGTLRGQVFENKKDNSPFMQVHANDPDAGGNGHVTYAIVPSGDDSRLFSIDPESGNISTRTSLDRERKAEYFLQIRATDKGTEHPMSSTATVTISILDENDNPPKFTKQAYFNSIVENLPRDSPAGDVSAYDSDTKSNGRMKYAIVTSGSVSSDGRFFNIDPDTGVIRSVTSFDRETRKSYHFKVKVYDTSLPNFYDTADVTITVTDDNDHAPMIVKPPPSDRTFSCAFNTTVGTIITVVEAKDRDDPALVEFSYTLQPTKMQVKDKPLFSVDTASGKLRLSRQIRPEDVATHQISVLVRDGPSASAQSSTVEISIVVEAGSPEAMRKFDEEGEKTNMVIVIVIIAITIVLAVVIVAVICLIRRVDKKRHPQPPPQNASEVDAKMYQAAKWVSAVSISNDLGPEKSVRATLEVPGTEKKKKKEVSFSLDEEVVESPDTSGSMGSVFTPSPNTTQKTRGRTGKTAPEEANFIVMNGLTSPDFSQHLYEQKASSTDPQDERQFMEVSRPGEDRYSDASSGDTGTSDSGRGGSEDESHAHTSSSGDGDHHNKFSPGNSVSSGIGSYTNVDVDNNHHHHNNNRQYQQQQQQQQQQQHPQGPQQPTPDPEDVVPGSPTPMLTSDPRYSTRSSYETLPCRSFAPSGSQRSSPCPASPPSHHNHNNNHHHNNNNNNNNNNSRLTYSDSTRNSSTTGSNSSLAANSNPNSHANARVTLSLNDVEGPYRVKKAEQQQQLLKTFSSPYSGRTSSSKTSSFSGANSPTDPNTPAPSSSTNTHPAWRKARGLDTSWRSNGSSHLDDDDNTTTSGSYTINPDDLREDVPPAYSPDMMV